MLGSEGGGCEPLDVLTWFLAAFPVHCRLQATNNGVTATADAPKGSGPIPTVKIDNLSDPFATVVRAAVRPTSIFTAAWDLAVLTTVTDCIAGDCGVWRQAGRAAGYGRQQRWHTAVQHSLSSQHSSS